MCVTVIYKRFSKLYKKLSTEVILFFSLKESKTNFLHFRQVMTRPPGISCSSERRLRLTAVLPLSSFLSSKLPSLVPRGSAGKFRSPQQTHQASFDWFLPQFQARERTPYGGLAGFNRNSTPLYSRFWKDWICIFALLCGIIQSQLKSIKAVIWVLILWRGFLFV